MKARIDKILPDKCWYSARDGSHIPTRLQAAQAMEQYAREVAAEQLDLVASQISPVSTTPHQGFNHPVGLANLLRAHAADLRKESNGP